MNDKTTSRSIPLPPQAIELLKAKEQAFMKVWPTAKGGRANIF
jgi:hypothetical protein